jgi:hypothetical protein
LSSEIVSWLLFRSDLFVETIDRVIVRVVVAVVVAACFTSHVFYSIRGCLYAVLAISDWFFAVAVAVVCFATSGLKQQAKQIPNIDIEITGTRRHQDPGSKPWIEYIVTIAAGSQTWEIRKRYRLFENFHSTVCRSSACLVGCKEEVGSGGVAVAVAAARCLIRW